jgi:tRNA pseudouridine38-40 synthase
MRTRLTLEYDGTDFAGWARQPDRRTVQGELERALATVLREELPIAVAGRTDAGVHAWAQVASYSGEAVDPARLNGLLPEDLAVLASEPAAAGFDARNDAVSRTYCYRLLARRTRSVFERRTAHWWAGPLDREALVACASLLGGKRDFTAFTPSETEHRWFRCDVRRAEWQIDGDLLEFWIEADMFLRHMVRVMVGTMLEVAAGRAELEQFAALLDGAPREHAGPTAPPRGLALAAVSYD